MKKRLYISLIVIAIVFFLVALSYYTSVGLDDMYIPADKHWQKNKIAKWSGKTGGRELSPVEQIENGVYFVYKDRLMYMESPDENVNEICKMPNQMVGILAKNSIIFC